ncbi:glycosyltransferase [Enorma phocaeensis]|uniref:glycosyltransferase n=1 Tax=Enorma phocaeensis TaxID=1871019 RepID=UPI00235609E1|nr:glycosyltransferase [Enorma phocaeensis]
MDHIGLLRFFDDNPITDEERSSGTILRLAKCFRSNQGAFSDGPQSYFWIILAATLTPKARIPRIIALQGGKRLVRRATLVEPKLLAKHRLYDEGCWEIEEYSACIPERYCRFLVYYKGHYLLAGERVTGELKAKYAELIANASVDQRYLEWLAAQRLSLLQRPVLKDGPLMSIVTPAYMTPPAFLREMVESVLAQTYPNWELVIVNASPLNEAMREVLDVIEDERVKIINCPDNLGITGNTNLGISHCTGEYISFFDHDDVIEPNALAEFVRVIVGGGAYPGLLYCDEDNIDENGNPSLPLIKPGYAEDFLLSNNYIIHWLTVRRDLLESVELSGSDVEGAQDYDLTFKIAEFGERAVRVPYVLYHWRIHSGSTAGDPASKSYAQDAGSRAIAEHLKRTGVNGRVSRGRAYFTYVTEFIRPSKPLSIEVVSPDGVSRATSAALNELAEKDGARVLNVEPHSYTPEFLRGLEADYALFCTAKHDLDYESLGKLISRVSQDEVFAAAPRVIRDDGLFDYAGMIICPDGTLRHLCRLIPEQDGGYVGRTERPYDATVLNHECALVDVKLLKSLPLQGGFSTTRYALVEMFTRSFCSGLRNVYLPYATAYLNAPRSFFNDGRTEAELNDAARFIHLFPNVAKGDPSHNPNFDPWNGYYRLNWARGESK